MRIQIGFSFIGVKYKNEIPEYIYYFAAPELSEIEEKFFYPADAHQFAKSLEPNTEADYLKQTFFNSQSGKIFDTSGIGPYALVACYIWITK